MIKKVKESMERNTTNWIIVTMFVIVLTILAFVYLVSVSKREFLFNDHLSDMAFEINEDVITLKEASYYILVIEASVNEAAMEYNSDNVLQYWNLYLNDGKDESSFLRTQAKKDAMDACVRDAIYYREAQKTGIELDKNEEKQCIEEAREKEKQLTGKQMEVTGYEYRDLYMAIKKIAIVKKHITQLMNEGYSEEELDVGGEYYEKMLKKYDITVNSDLWEKITLGDLTIN